MTGAADPGRRRTPLFALNLVPLNSVVPIEPRIVASFNGSPIEVEGREERSAPGQALAVARSVVLVLPSRLTL